MRVAWFGIGILLAVIAWPFMVVGYIGERLKQAAEWCERKGRE